MELRFLENFPEKSPMVCEREIRKGRVLLV